MCADELAVPLDDVRSAVLMERVGSGDRSALALLVDRYWAPLIRTAAGIVGSADEAEDVVQEVFVRVWRQRASWRPTGTVSGYLYRITRNLALNARRDAAVERRSRERGAADTVRDPSTPAEDFLARRLQRDVAGAIAALPERRREIFMLSRFHGLSHREIAEALEISPQTVANQMSAALDALRSALAHRVTRG